MNSKTADPTFYFLNYDYDRLNPDLGGNEIELVYPKEITSTFTTVNGPETATLDLVDWLTGDDPFELEEPVQFTGFFPTILKTDAPISERVYPLYSKKFLDALKTLGPFDGRVFQTQIEDDVVGSGDDPNYPLGRITDQFVLIWFPHLDILDAEASVYSYRSPRSGMVTGLQNVVLNIPEEGLPPIFRLKASPVLILVSAVAKAALEESKISGLKFSTHPFGF